MSLRLITTLALLAVAGAPHAGGDAPRPTTTIPICSDDEIKAPSVESDEADAHRRFAKPLIHYPFGESPPLKRWQSSLVLRVEPGGRVSCYQLGKSGFYEKTKLDARRQVVVDQIGRWRFAPFFRKGKPVAVTVVQELDEQEDPAVHRPLPKVPMEQVEIRLRMTTCYGTCPDFEVVLHGDGRAEFNGNAFVDVAGRHEYSVPVADIAALVESIRREDLWSLRETYSVRISDSSMTELRLRFGADEHRIVDYYGRLDGMPEGVLRVQREVARVARADEWLQLSNLALDVLEREGFDFHSTEAGSLLARAIANDEPARAGVLDRLIALGAPLDQPEQLGWGTVAPSTLEMALVRGRVELVDPLIARGALDVDGKRSQAKVDAAFVAAIRGGRLEGVQAIWNQRGSAKPPALTYEPIADDGKRLPKAPVSLLLERPSEERQWDAAGIAKWLRAHGVDLKARSAEGDTLLHYASLGNDAAFVRFLLAAGLDPDSLNNDLTSALDYADREEVALALLEAGASPLGKDPTYTGPSLRDRAIEGSWDRVVAWLDAHPPAKKKAQ